MNNELIVVRQLPVIEEQLRSVRDSIQARVDEVLAMECNEDTYKKVKNARSELNAQYKGLEEKRKAVKAQVEAPYKKFEAVYKEFAGDIFAKADKDLAAKISAVEDGLKKKKADKVKAYFDEYRESLGIPEDLVSYGQARIAVTLSASEKSLKTLAKNFLDRIRGDLDLIATQEHKDEILVEYSKTLNISLAVTTVTNRIAAVENQRRMREQAATEQARRQKAAEAVQMVAETARPAPPAVISAPVVMAQPEQEMEVVPPVVVAQPEYSAHVAKMYTVTFKVYGTIDQMRDLKKFLENGGYVYEQLK